MFRVQSLRLCSVEGHCHIDLCPPAQQVSLCRGVHRTWTGALKGPAGDTVDV